MIRKRNGFSLLEILIATAIFMVILVAAVGIFSNTTASSSTASQLRLNVQTGRFIFETMAREVRLSRGLVLNENTVPARPRFVVPPFRVVMDGTKPVGIAVFQVERNGTDTATSEPLYKVTCRAYGARSTQFSVWVYRSAQNMTATAIRGAITLETCRPQTSLGAAAAAPVGPSYWQSTVVTPSDLLPEKTTLGEFKILNWRDYPVSPDDLIVQPFVQLQFSVLNINQLASGQTGEKARTTLRSMIVPRDFSAKYEVAQQGVKGVGQ